MKMNQQNSEINKYLSRCHQKFLNSHLFICRYITVAKLQVSPNFIISASYLSYISVSFLFLVKFYLSSAIILSDYLSQTLISSMTDFVS